MSDAKERAAAAAAVLRNKKDEQSVWVENLLAADSVYRSDRTKEKYEMAPYGVSGSVISVPVKVAKESFFRRSIERGNLQLLSDSDARAREADLEVAASGDEETSRLMEALEKGASESGSRWTKKGLLDDATERQSIPAKQVWASKAERATTVRRSDAPVLPVDEGPIEAVITERVREGDPNFKTQTAAE